MDVEAIEQVITDAWAEWDRARAVPVHGQEVPAQSAPVLWFGPLDGYDRSARRVLTLGVNPGPLTFKAPNWWAGLPALDALGPVERRAPAACRAAYDAYPACEQPHAPWFRAWNALIEPVGAGWPETTAPGRPLHVDLSPIATVKVFSELDAAFAPGLRANGIALLKPLLRALDPHVTFASLSRTNFDAMVAPLGVVPHTRVPVDGIEAWICDWDAPGVLVWVRKTNMPSVSGTREQRAAVGAWVRQWMDRPEGRPKRETFIRVRGARDDSRDAVADGLVRTIHDVVADMQAACPVGPAGTWVPDFAQPQWKWYGQRWGWGRRWTFLAPNGELAELSTMGRPERVVEFLKDWEVHAAEMAHGDWGRKTAKMVEHIVFSVGGEMKRYRGLYFRWVG